MKFKKFLATFLAIMCAFSTIPVYALESNTIIETTTITETVTINDPEIEELAETLENSAIISNVIVSGNTVSYIIENNIEASITKRSEKGISIYTVVEDGKTDEIIINPLTNELYMNGNMIEANVTTTYIPSNVQPMGTEFVYYGTREYNVSLTTRVRYATLSSILLAMRALIAPTSIDLPTLCAHCISFAEATQSNSDDIVVDRTTYMHVDYIAYRYYDTYEIDGETVTTDVFEYWQ